MIIGLMGQKRAGKDTVGQVLARELNGVCMAFADPIKRFFSHAYQLSEAQLWGERKEVEFVLPERPSAMGLLASLEVAVGVEDFGLDEDRIVAALDKWARHMPAKTTPRFLMQTFGTEGLRSTKPTFWLEHGLRIADELLAGRRRYTPLGGVAVSDKSYDAVVLTDVRFRNEALGVRRPRYGFVYRVDRPSLEVTDAHASEVEQQGIPERWLDGVLLNNGTQAELETAALQLAAQLKYPLVSTVLNGRLKVADVLKLVETLPP